MLIFETTELAVWWDWCVTNRPMFLLHVRAQTRFLGSILEVLYDLYEGRLAPKIEFQIVVWREFSFRVYVVTCLINIFSSTINWVFSIFDVSGGFVVHPYLQCYIFRFSREQDAHESEVLIVDDYQGKCPTKLICNCKGTIIEPYRSSKPNTLWIVNLRFWKLNTYSWIIQKRND